MRHTNLPRTTHSRACASALETALETALALEARRTIETMAKAMRSGPAQGNAPAKGGSLQNRNARTGDPASVSFLETDYTANNSDLAAERERASRNSALYEPGRHLALMTGQRRVTDRKLYQPIRPGS